MIYEQWRNELFGLAPESDPVMHEHSEEFYAVPSQVAFDYVDQVLVDPDVHSVFTKDQLGKGISTIYSNCCSDLPFLYTTECGEDRRVAGINNLVNLYRNYFDRHCTGNVTDIGNDENDGPLGYICYMLWDVFVLYPGNATPAMISAAIGVMRSALESSNDNSLASAIHGLGHWAFGTPEAVTTLEHWLQKPTTDNPVVLQYARTATSGMIL
ncbi:HEAT repeat domain-containing protein [Crateriforma conspicua]|uniref:HEAT repeat domain-containing protein n=1 Tax=Crateriforma conspicua TaxID=2527996 RepID=UPI00118D3CD2|nr:HEAT repeat domain-containing protein [Crateriforma conspicua]QDV61080.1 hypothetical protein Mal65_02030 [Crateriforma conspicua]